MPSASCVLRPEQIIASSEAASDAAEGEVDAGVAEQPLVLSTPDEVGSLRSGGDAEERVMDGMSAMDEAPSRAPTAISGGYSYRQVSGGVEVTGYSGAGGDIVVPDALDGSPVVSIAARAFMNNASLSSVVLPSSVSKVGDRAFWGCSSLSSVTLAEGLKYLGAEAFSGCAVSSVLVPASLEATGGQYLGPGPFAGCPLSSASLAPGASRVAPGLFAECASLASFEVPEGVSEVGNRAFAGCTSLASVGLPSSVREVGDRAFAGCPLSSVELPSSVSKVGDALTNSTGCCAPPDNPVKRNRNHEKRYFITLTFYYISVRISVCKALPGARALPECDNVLYRKS